MDTPTQPPNIGPRLRELRDHRRLTQLQLGERCGLTARSASVTVSRWESGKATPSLARLFRIADALGVPAWELLTRRGRPLP